MHSCFHKGTIPTERFDILSFYKIKTSHEATVYLDMLLQLCKTNSLTMILVTNYIASRNIPEKQVYVFSLSGS
jgi:hypothetical protein